MIDPNNAYTNMQKDFISKGAVRWSVQGRDHVVGSFDAHNNWKDYEKLFEGIDTSKMIALDFGCGPGRNIVQYHNRFARIDGTDILELNVNNAKVWANHSNVDVSNANFYVTNGVDLQDIPDNTYDLVYSTICFQHIAVYDIRRQLMEEIYRVLKIGGIFTAQMGYGTFGNPRATNINISTYYENKWDAPGTNGVTDVTIQSYEQLQKDFEEIGFKDFSYYIGPTGPGDAHENWIYFRGTKAKASKPKPKPKPVKKTKTNKKIDADNSYTSMQRRNSDKWAALWTPTNRDHVVGMFDAHNNWPGYEKLFEGLDTSKMIALDFACGPGRNIVKYRSRFARIDGADIAADNIKNVSVWAAHSNVDISNSKLYHMNGVDLQDIKDDTYDLIFSTIAVQHICVYDIRRCLFEEFFRVLKPGGMISIQMGYGGVQPWADATMVSSYFENRWDMPVTGGEADVTIHNVEDLKKDLEEIGFTNFSYQIDDTGPGDKHMKWIYFRGIK